MVYPGSLHLKQVHEGTITEHMDNEDVPGCKEAQYV